MASHLDTTCDDLVVGVSVEYTSVDSPSCNNNNSLCDVLNVTGIVKISPTNLTASQLRDVLRRELPALPPNYLFLTKQGWPVRIEQENDIRVLDLLDDRSLITVRRHFTHPKVGVRNLSKEVIGFIFIDYNSSVPQLKQALRDQLTFPTSDILLCDGKGWPVHQSQEKDLVLWDLLCEGYITIRASHTESLSHSMLSIDSPDGESKRRRISDWNGTNHHNHYLGESKSLTELENGDSPKVLISYVRAEAAKHAKDLKWQLTDKGYKVFLDVDEIHGGRDWQDALNLAVQNCHLFIPLITPLYGQTIWTNREVKLADQLKKLIIPINFLNTWPPECLAIQFASLHFLPWKTVLDIQEDKLDGLEERATDFRFWDTVYIKHTVDSITKCYQEHLYSQESLESKPSEEDPDASSVLKRGRSHLTLPTAALSEIEFDRPIEPKPLVVLSAHPSDESVITTIRTVLSAHNYDVWASSDTLDEFETLSCTQGSLSRLTSPMTPVAMDSGFTEMPSSLNTNSQESTGSESFYHGMPKKRPSLQFSYSIDQPIFLRSDSQITLSPVAMDKLRVFRNRANKAGVVIILLSEDYCKARTSLKQVYYCEHRKQVIPIKITDFRLPSSFNNLLRNDILQFQDSTEFFDNLRHKVKVAMETKESEQPKICTKEIQLQSKVTELKESVGNEYCIYVTGSTRICNPRTSNICIAIGQELAACTFISLATSGFYGVAETIGRSFCEEQELMGQKPAHLYNILPFKDSKDLSKVSRQSREGNFQKVPYGQTLFIGGSTCERDSIVARSFNVCLLIEGDSESAGVAEQFLWNDNIVIPVVSTGGAAGGNFGSRFMDVPTGVSEGDWMLLSKKDQTVEEIASAVKRILCSLKSKENLLGDIGKAPRGKRSSRKSNKVVPSSQLV